MLKIIGLGILVLAFNYSYKSFKSYKEEIKSYVMELTPPRYSMNNPKVVTV